MNYLTPELGALIIYCIGCIFFMVGLVMKVTCKHEDEEYLGKRYDWVVRLQHSDDYVEFYKCKRCGKNRAQEHNYI